jgi:hypothetical protein
MSVSDNDHEIDALVGQLAGVLLPDGDCDDDDAAAAVCRMMERLMRLSGGKPDGLQSMVERGCAAANRVLLLTADKDGEPGAGVGRRARADGVLQALYYLNHTLRSALISHRLLGAVLSERVEDVRDEELAAGIARFTRMDTEDANRTQQLLLYLLNCAQVHGYRRVNGECYSRVVTPEGHDTHAWRHACSVRDFVYESTRKELCYEHWLNLTSMRTNLSAVVEHLTHCRDVQFPDLRRDRHVFAFRDGIYLASKDEFMAYATPGAGALPTELSACRYSDLPFLKRGGGGLEERSAGATDDSAAEEAEEGAWYDGIETPHLQKIMDYQGMEREVCRWMYVMIGRLIYDVNERDTWQVIPFLKGAASSGKSTILVRVCRGLYEPADVGVLSNNIEKKFGLSALHDKLLFIAPEVKADLGLEQAEFQSLVSGETVQINAKFKTATAIEWRVPGILAGNEVPAWVDNSGSINRRIVLFEFNRRVENGDMELGAKLELEMPAILLKANRAYLEAVRLHSRDNLWLHLPPEMHRAKEDLTESINPMVAYLRSGALSFGRDLYMPLFEFTTAAGNYAAQMGHRRQRMNTDTLLQPLLSVGCRVAKGKTLRYPRSGGSVMSGSFVIGADYPDPVSAASETNEDDDPLGG